MSRFWLFRLFFGFSIMQERAIREVRKGNACVNLDIKKTSHAFELDFRITGRVCVPCDRCLDDVEVAVDATEKLTVKMGHEYAEEDNNLIVIPEEEGEINVAWFMYEFIALAIPMKHVHAEGECNEDMMHKLNEHLCTDADDNIELGEDDGVVSEKPIDPRWNELKKILDNN